MYYTFRYCCVIWDHFSLSVLFFAIDWQTQIQKLWISAHTQKLNKRWGYIRGNVLFAYVACFIKSRSFTGITARNVVEVVLAKNAWQIGKTIWMNFGHQNSGSFLPYHFGWAPQAPLWPTVPSDEQSSCRVPVHQGSPRARWPQWAGADVSCALCVHRASPKAGHTEALPSSSSCSASGPYLCYWSKRKRC